MRLSVGDTAVLEMENDGVRTGSGGSGGSGITGLRERLAALGGTVTVQSRGGRFRLTAEVPLVTGRAGTRPVAGTGAGGGLRDGRG
ncbi:hypothetical protein IHE55_15960 [Streptomyces pactum]|uniref:Histidine kinase n=1 Tax=Streptomyces pactum TaxID=68249 RepID=A0ABS0NLX8_9ACTN|nr:hypothetical protein [Streptomyces pactum]MBH5336200.1 hypothetical protein [Streptomyces pactum]